MSKEKLWTIEFIMMSCSNFFQFISQYILVAALPIFIMDELSGGELEAGLAMTFFQIGTVCCRPFAGRWIDTVNKQKLLLVTTGLFFLVMAGFSFANSLHAVLLLRLLHGILFALGTTAASTMAALILPNSCKGEGIGYFAVSTNLAMVVGPLIGLLIIHQWGASALFIFLTIVALFTIGVSNCKKLESAITEPALREKKGWNLQDFVEKKSLPMAFLGGLVFFAYGGILTFIPLYAKTLGLSTATSLFFMVFALVIVITRPFIGRIFDYKGADFTVYPGFLFFIAGLVLFSSVTTLTGLLFSAAVLGIGFGALSPAFQTLAIQSAPAERAGVATATYFWSLDISVGLAAILLSMVAERNGYAFMYGVVCANVILAAVICYSIWRKFRR
ncbi:MFS transporter [Anaerosinus massiliensis]|uniref:MFS transporter n=1 Tax=Massilibacillus massiliensis TaxID=1806837 RepID=UPI000A66DAE4|nr:MFS transporter [Massilibacillus massiliensis]